jgi:hypothetical protein
MQKYCARNLQSISSATGSKRFYSKGMLRRSILALLLAIPGNSQEPKKPQILVIGVFHLGSTTDLFAGEKQDWRSPEREKQVLEVVERLRAFNPTKVALEYVDGKSKAAEQYAAFLEGKYQLKANEIDLIGFRLAKAAGHSRVYGIDDRDIPWDFEALQKFGQEKGFADKLQEFVAFGKEAMDWQNRMVRENRLLVVLRELNSPEMLRRRQSFEMKMLDLNKDSEHAGAELVSNWYKRVPS